MFSNPRELFPGTSCVGPDTHASRVSWPSVETQNCRCQRNRQAGPCSGPDPADHWETTLSWLDARPRHSGRSTSPSHLGGCTSRVRWGSGRDMSRFPPSPLLLLCRPHPLRCLWLAITTVDHPSSVTLPSAFKTCICRPMRTRLVLPFPSSPVGDSGPTQCCPHI